MPLVEGERKPIRFVQTEFDEFDGAFSPDGKWIGYTSDETGRFEVYLQAFLGGNAQAPRAKWQVSTKGGSRLRWRRDGKELYYVAPDGDLMSVPVKTDPTLVAGAPKKLFHTGISDSFSSSNNISGFAVAANGQRFLIDAPLGEQIPAPITVMLNWTAGLKRQ